MKRKNVPPRGTEYRVRWEIDVVAPDPISAARIAQSRQRDPDTTANVFDVRPLYRDEDEGFDTIDLDEEESC